MGDLNLLATHISHAAEAAEADVLQILKTAKLQEQCYAYKSRVKPWDKLVQKVNIKRKEKEYSVLSVTDVLGLRVVTLFRQDMVNVVDTLLGLISHSENYNPNPFVMGSLKEAIIYTPSIGNDPVISQVKRNIQSSELIAPDQVKENASAARYSSIHLVAYVDKQVPEVEDTYRVPIEIQIRTVFEDAWGEIDHKYNYQDKQGKSNTPIQNSIQVGKNILTLKRFVDACAEYADNIKDLAIGKEEYSNSYLSLDTDELVSTNLEESGVDQSLISSFMEIRKIRAEAESGKGTNPQQTYLTAAESFSSLYDQVQEGKIIEEERAFKTFRYYLKIDEALCRLSIGSYGESRKALITYEELLKQYPTYPVIKFRAGQALLSLNRFEEARTQLKQCRKNIQRLAPIDESKRRFTLPDVELKRIEVGLPKFLGLSYWKEANEIYASIPRSPKVKSFLEQAYSQTKLGLDVEGLTEVQKLKLKNNLLFYALEIVFFKKVNGKNQSLESEIQCLTAAIAEKLEVEHSTNVNQLDTLMCAYLYLGEKEKALKIADRLEKLTVKYTAEGKQMDPLVVSRVNKLIEEAS